MTPLSTSPWPVPAQAAHPPPERRAPGPPRQLPQAPGPTCSGGRAGARQRGPQLKAAPAGRCGFLAAAAGGHDSVRSSERVGAGQDAARDASHPFCDRRQRRDELGDFPVRPGPGRMQPSDLDVNELTADLDLPVRHSPALGFEPFERPGRHLFRRS